MGVRESLASLGTDRGQFNQSTFRGTVIQYGDTDLTGGYCAGVCLDWTRRVLLSASNRDAKYLTYSTPKGASETRHRDTLIRMAVAFEEQNSYRPSKPDVMDKLTALLSQPDSTYNIDGKVVSGVAIPGKTAELIAKFVDLTQNNNPFNMRKEPAGVVPRTRVEAWKNLIGGMKDWGQYAGELDTRLSHSKKKKFGNLSVVASSPQTVYSSPSVWLGELMSDGFRDNCCTIIGCGPPGDTGHAVAVHQIGADYRFFDPNYGVFDFSKKSLQCALQHLFWTPYFKNDPGLDADLPVYRRRDTQSEGRSEKEWTRMNYTMFKANV